MGANGSEPAGLVDEGEAHVSIPDWILLGPLLGDAKVLYGILKHYARRAGSAFPSMPTLANDLVGRHTGKCCPSRVVPGDAPTPRHTDTVKRLTERLVEFGALTVQPRWKGRGENGEVVYYLQPGLGRAQTSHLYTLRWREPKRADATATAPIGERDESDPPRTDAGTPNAGAPDPPRTDAPPPNGGKSGPPRTDAPTANPGNQGAPRSDAGEDKSGPPRTESATPPASERAKALKEEALRTKNKKNNTSADAAAAPPTPNGKDNMMREDVERLCAHLVDRIVGNNPGARPRVSQKWRDAARLLMDRDGHPEASIRAAIDWCQRSEFWRTVILSMPNLREHYERLQAQALREQQRDGGGRANGNGHRPPNHVADPTVAERHAGMFDEPARAV